VPSSDFGTLPAMLRTSREGIRVLVVEDDPEVAELIRSALLMEGFRVEAESLGRAALERMAKEPFDVVVLDIMLPDMDGLAVCEHMRSKGMETGVLFVSARGDIGDKVAGLRAGGDDYLPKPFALEELIARVEALGRRLRAAPDARLVFEDVVMDTWEHRVFRSGKEVTLTATEFALLKELMSSPRRVFTKAELLERVWGIDFDGAPNLVETYISYLRKKLDALGPPVIQTVRGVGYCLRRAETSP
jgi:two-component system OmpR family response regulator